MQRVFWRGESVKGEGGPSRRDPVDLDVVTHLFAEISNKSDAIRYKPPFEERLHNNTKRERIGQECDL